MIPCRVASGEQDPPIQLGADSGPPTWVSTSQPASVSRGGPQFPEMQPPPHVQRGCWQGDEFAPHQKGESGEAKVFVCAGRIVTTIARKWAVNPDGETGTKGLVGAARVSTMAWR